MSGSAIGKNAKTFGVIAIILGVLALLAPGLTGLSIMTFLGIIVLLGGIVRMLWAFKADSLGKGIWVFVIGLLTMLAGIALLANPVFAAGMLTVMLVIYFILDGIFEMVAGFGLRPAPGSGWLIFGGIISILLGIMLWRQYPLSGPMALGILVGIKLFFIGIIMVTGGSAISKIANE
jgi:uncharacterized membrane protein HdeD (DUF308 family)